MNPIRDPSPYRPPAEHVDAQKKFRRWWHIVLFLTPSFFLHAGVAAYAFLVRPEKMPPSQALIGVCLASLFPVCVSLMAGVGFVVARDQPGLRHVLLAGTACGLIAVSVWPFTDLQEHWGTRALVVLLATGTPIIVSTLHPKSSVHD